MATYVEEKEYKAQLVQLQKVVPEWLTLLTMPQMTLVKQLKKFQVFELRDQIKSHFKVPADTQ
jgi:hypothetical protein